MSDLNSGEGNCYEFQVVDDRTLLVRHFHSLDDDAERFFDFHRDEIAEVAGWETIVLKEEESRLLLVEFTELTYVLNTVDTSNCLFVIRRIPRSRKPPYLVHTGHEFSLMKSRVKPLSVFTEYMSGGGEIIDSIFDIFRDGVADNDWQWRRYYAVDFPYSRDDAVDTLLFCLPGEEWRIDCYIMLKSFSDTIALSDDFIIIQGALLGYEYWQTLYYLADRRRRRS